MKLLCPKCKTPVEFQQAMTRKIFNRTFGPKWKTAVKDKALSDILGVETCPTCGNALQAEHGPSGWQVNVINKELIN